jgi:hypothetical protein
LSSKGIKEKLLDSYETGKFQDFLPISNLIIPFSVIFRKTVALDIYTGNESVPFEERDSNFKQILKNEFDIALKEFINQINSKY